MIRRWKVTCHYTKRVLARRIHDPDIQEFIKKHPLDLVEPSSSNKDTATCAMQSGGHKDAYALYPEQISAGILPLWRRRTDIWIRQSLDMSSVVVITVPANARLRSVRLRWMQLELPKSTMLLYVTSQLLLPSDIISQWNGNADLSLRLGLRFGWWYVGRNDYTHGIRSWLVVKPRWKKFRNVWTYSLI